MQNDVYKLWAPIEQLPPRLYCEGLYDDYEGFRILLRGEGTSSNMLRIRFSRILFYRNIDEGDLLESIAKIPNVGTSTLFVVENSTLIKWFQRESQSIHDANRITHYAIYTPNDCIDVLAEQEPIVEWL